MNKSLLRDIKGTIKALSSLTEDIESGSDLEELSVQSSHSLCRQLADDLIRLHTTLVITKENK